MDLTASSAGVHAVVGAGIEPNAALVLRGLGGDPEGFYGRQLTAEHIREADLILCMTKRHRDAVLKLSPRSLAITFTLREAGTLLSYLDRDRARNQAWWPQPQSTHSGESAVGGLAHGDMVVAALARARAVRAAADGGKGNDDVPDPMGRDLARFQMIGDAIASRLLPLLVALTDPFNPVWATGESGRPA